MSKGSSMWWRDGYGLTPQAKSSSELEDAVLCEPWELDQLAEWRRDQRSMLGGGGEREGERLVVAMAMSPTKGTRANQEGSSEPGGSAGLWKDI